MKFIVFLAALVLLFSAGCVSMDTIEDNTPATEAPTPVKITMPTATPTPQVTEAPQPVDQFPDAMELKEKYSYGDEEDGRVMSVYNAFTDESYWYHSTAHGYDWEFEPKEGNQFLFVELWVKHNGTKRELGAPPAGNLIVWFEGVPYSSTEEREDAVERVTKPEILDDDYVGGILGRYAKSEGFLIYEVPEELRTDRAYLQANLGNVYGNPVWKLY
ncbi:hypothetical protein [Methanoplanus endosymbiosus]|uniref:Uncharacterized protein n=1 Tax=Methanoplanus endosymbiosus TaxID=33865 RepID=A0A9E7PRE8_9EURY|nr:hypothetical protein [Methanoplanus endosymbiosus]UUX92167.1 hypothetical protein L6E24_12525 [Methanoplanus endosymbiosus]